MQRLRTVITTLPNNLQSKHNDSFNAYGVLTETDDYDYGSGAPGTLLRQTLITYASLQNITAFRQQVTVKNGSGTIVSQTNYNYDETGVTATSGTPQHGSVSGSRGNLTSINYPVSGLTNHSTYYDTGTMNAATDVNGAVTTYNYNSNSCGNSFPTSVSEPLSISSSMTWNCTGGVQLTSTDENNQTTTTAYTDPYFWRPASISFPDGGLTSRTYNSPTSVTTTTKMNSSQNILSTVLLDGLGRASQTQLNDPEGTDYSVVTYDTLGRPYKAYNPTRCSPPTTNCGESTWGYTATAYDALGRPNSVTLQDGSVATVSYTNNTVTTADPAGKKRQGTFDALGRLTQVNEDPAGLNYATTYSYDALSNLASVTQNGGRQRTYTYDALSRLVCESNPEIQVATCPNPDNGSYTAGTIRYSYDNNGNLTSKQAPAPNQTGSATVTSTYSWDSLHRLTQKSYSDGTTPVASYLYDVANTNGVTLLNPMGRLSRANTPVVESLFSYDPLGRVVTHWQTTPHYNSVAFVLSHSYDLAGDETSYSNGVNITFTQSFDTAGRPTALTSSLVDSQHPATLATVDSTLGYYPHGALRKMTSGNGLTQTAAFNNDLQPCRINVNSSGTALGTCADAIPSGNLLDLNYGFNLGSSDNGNVMSWAATGQQAFNRSFTYDSLNRLSTLNQSSGNATGCSATFNLSWAYDAWGNRTDQTVNGGTCNAFHATVNTQNHLVGPPYLYDAAGNMTYDGNHTYFYDAESRLIQVDGTIGTCSTATACYSYDANSLRVEKAIGSTYLDYLYNLAGKVVTEWCTNCAGYTGPTTEYLLMSGSFVAEYENDTTYFAHLDHLGSARLLTALSQSVSQNLDYLPFGELNSSDSGITTHKFTGDERDAETNLDHTWFRQNSSAMGRWTTPDPAGLAAVDPTNPQSWNRYSYVMNNPMVYIDPHGLTPQLFCNPGGSISDGQEDASGEGIIASDFYASYFGADCFIFDDGVNIPSVLTTPPRDPRCPGKVVNYLVSNIVRTSMPLALIQQAAKASGRVVSLGYDLNGVAAFGTFGASMHLGDALAFDPNGGIALISTTGAGGGFGGESGLTGQVGIMRATSVLGLESGTTINTMVAGGEGVVGGFGSDLEGNLTFQFGPGDGLATSSTYDVATVKIIACGP